MVKWVKESWDAVDINIIKRSFKCCGILNAINGSEDTLIFNFNKYKTKIIVRGELKRMAKIMMKVVMVIISQMIIVDQILANVNQRIIIMKKNEERKVLQDWH